MILQIGLQTSRLLGPLSTALQYRLENELFFENKGHIIQRIRAYKKHGYIPKRLRWNGRTVLFKKDGSFPSGLVPRVRAILADMSIVFTEVEDYTVPSGKPLAINNEQPLWDHQRTAIEQIKTHRHGVIQIGTGGGKTIMSVNAVAEIGQLPCLFVVNRISLLRQAHRDFEQLLGQKVGFIGNGTMSFGQVNVATINTICSVLKIAYEAEEDESMTYTDQQIKMLRALLMSCKFLIVDECHHAASDMYLKLGEHVPLVYYKVGLSATPFLRNDGMNLVVEGAFGEVLFAKSASELINEKVLSPVEITFCNFEDPLTKQYSPKARNKKQYNTVYKHCIVENELYNRHVAKIALVNAKLGRLTLVSVRQINHGDNIMKILKELAPDLNIVFLHGKNKDKLGEQSVLQDFSDHKIPILVSTLMDEGVDLPKIDAVINAGAGGSAIKTLQLIGRTLRKYPGKKKAYVYEFIHRYTYLYKGFEERLNILKTEPAFERKVLQLK